MKAKVIVEGFKPQVVDLIPDAENESDMIGQWFVWAEDPSKWYGPVTHLDMFGNLCGNNCCGVGNWVIHRKWADEGKYLLIPSPPIGAPADLKGWECREPKEEESFYPLSGWIGAPYLAGHPTWDQPYYGQRRWIPPQPVKRSPKGFTLWYEGITEEEVAGRTLLWFSRAGSSVTVRIVDIHGQPQPGGIIADFEHSGSIYLRSGISPEHNIALDHSGRIRIGNPGFKPF